MSTLFWTSCFYWWLVESVARIDGMPQRMFRQLFWHALYFLKQSIQTFTICKKKLSIFKKHFLKQKTTFKWNLFFSHIAKFLKFETFSEFWSHYRRTVVKFSARKFFCTAGKHNLLWKRTVNFATLSTIKALPKSTGWRWSMNFTSWMNGNIWLSERYKMRELMPLRFFVYGDERCSSSMHLSVCNTFSCYVAVGISFKLLMGQWYYNWRRIFVRKRCKGNMKLWGIKRN